MSALAIDLETRDRVDLAGVYIAGVVVEEGQTSEVQAAVVVMESPCNWPKYF